MDVYEQAAVRPRRFRAPWIAGAAVVVLAAGLGIGYAAFGGHSSSTGTTPGVPATSAGTFTLIGAITLPDSDIVAGPTEGTCHGSFEGYQDITAGASVVVTDQSGTTIGTGTLQMGNGVATAAGGVECSLGFAVTDVPDDRTFYGVTVSHRGTVQFSAAEAKSGHAALSLGG